MPGIKWTSETARAAAHKSNAVRRRKREEKRAREERDRQLVKQHCTSRDDTQDYQQIRIARIRAALDRYDELLLTEVDPQKAQWLATVVAKLSELERILDGRPNPGHLRPSAPSRRSAGIGALVPE